LLSECKEGEQKLKEMDVELTKYKDSFSDMEARVRNAEKALTEERVLLD